MANIRPFQGLRFQKKAGDLSSLCCPPYDVINEKERQALYKISPYNVIRLEYNASQDPYGSAAALLREWLDTGILGCDEKEAIYVYEESFSLPSGEQKATRGFIARIFLTPFSEGVVLPHEETLSGAKKDRFSLMEATGCNFSPIYSLYHDEEGAVKKVIDRAVLQKPQAEFSIGDGVTHRLWAITDTQEIDQIVRCMAEKKVYIADGHHRYETAVNYKNYLIGEGCMKGTEDEAPCYQMMAFVDMEDPGLVVLPTHRILSGLSDFSPERALKKISEYFSVEDRKGTECIEAALAEKQREGKTAFAFYTGGEHFQLLTLEDSCPLPRFMPDKCDAYRHLDVAVLHEVILCPVFGIDKENMARQKNLTYTRLISDAVEQVRQGEAQAAFLINATRVSEIRDVAQAGEKMPQKSTYFYPKLITGAVMNKFM